MCSSDNLHVGAKVRVSIVTPVRNAQAQIARTMVSILTQDVFQDRTVELEYVIVDGQSTDGTLSVVEKTLSLMNAKVRLVSEPDRGMYDALSKGLRLTTGAIIGYLNAGDILYPGAIRAVVQALSIEDVSWITGTIAVISSDGITYSVQKPYRYLSKFIKWGAYGIQLPFIQQESTFWRHDLMELIDIDLLGTFRLAGDFYLWYKFSSQHKLFVVDALLGGFERKSGQLSEDLVGYRSEVQNIADPRSSGSCFALTLERVYWAFFFRVQTCANSGRDRIAMNDASQRFVICDNGNCHSVRRWLSSILSKFRV